MRGWTSLIIQIFLLKKILNLSGKIFCKIFNIDIDNFKFDKINKYNKLRFNGNDILLFRFEDLEYITQNILHSDIFLTF